MEVGLLTRTACCLRVLAPPGFLDPNMMAPICWPLLGGAGTLAVGLRSGCPTVVCPFIFDQEYFGGLVEEQRCGRIMPPVKELTTAQLARAINEVPETRYRRYLFRADPNGVWGVCVVGVWGL